MGNFESLLEATGGTDDIVRAIEAKDLAAAVRAATNTLDMAGSIPMHLKEEKSTHESNVFRKQGNQHYTNKEYKEAIVCYNKALAYAPMNSLELQLAYGNISAVLLSIKEQQACLANAKAALQPDSPRDLRKKLEKRIVEAKKNMYREIKPSSKILADKHDMIRYTKFEVERNSDIPCASKSVAVVGGKVVAAEDINSGSMVALEKAFVSVQDGNQEYSSCYYCHKMGFFFIPCEGCCKALFCSEECRAECLEQFHRVECHIVPLMGTMYVRDVNKMAVRAAITLSLKLGWDQLGIASLKMGKELLEKSSVAEAFDSSNAASLLCFDDQIPVPMAKMKNASIICAATIHCLGRAPNYLPEGKDERENAIDSLSRVILHLNTAFLRKISITSSAVDVATGAYRCGAQRCEGWFSFASKLTHSCEPNLLVVGFNDHVGLVAIEQIKKGKQLTISYVEHFYELNKENHANLRVRQKMLRDRLQISCQCRVCINEWHSNSQVHRMLTSSQSQAYVKCNLTMIFGTFVQKMYAIGVALDKLTGCGNTIQHHDMFGQLRRTLNFCQCIRDGNKVYGGASKYYFRVDSK